MTDSDHDCPAPGCTRRVPYEQLACRSHWYAIPKMLRLAVWSAYRTHGPGSKEHRDAITAAIDYLNQSVPA